MAYNAAEECGVDALLSLPAVYTNQSKVTPVISKKQRKKKNKKQKRLKPKKAMTPFMVFSKETRKLLVQENPSLTFSEIGKELGARWRSLNEEGRKQYVVKANEDYQRFLKECEEMESQCLGKKRKTIEQKKQTKKKKAISAYLYFCNAHREQVKALYPDMKMVEIQRMLAEKWKQSSEVLKVPFEKQAEADREKYNSEIEKSQPLLNSIKNENILFRANYPLTSFPINADSSFVNLDAIGFITAANQLNFKPDMSSIPKERNSSYN